VEHCPDSPALTPRRLLASPTQRASVRTKRIGDGVTPAEFIDKWSDATLRERQGSHEHFIDLCRLLGQPTPAEDDPHGERYCFERGATKAGGGDGWADVWRRGCFGWEYKGPHKDLNAAYRQLTIYASNLESPPYLVVSDMARIVIHTNWTNTVSRVIELSLEDLREPAKLDLLRQVFEGSDRLKPSVSPQELTAKVAQRFGELGRRLQDRGHPPRDVAHFLNRLVFCMFAEDAKLLPDKLFTRLIRNTERRPEQAGMQLEQLFSTMRTGGFFGVDTIHWFNGGLFDEAPALPLEAADLKLIGDTSDEHNWSEIDPAVFGTLFEEALKATRQRAALGAHYTDREKILKIVEPGLVRPLTAEWEAALAEIKAHGQTMKAADAERRAIMDAAGEAMKVDPQAAKAGEAGRRKKLSAIARRRSAAFGAAKDRLEAFLSRLAAYRVLDPACGSGNFLYVALHALKDRELRAIIDAERAAGVPPPAPRVGLDCVRGIEIEAYAAELARVTLWIGDLQWMRKNGYSAYAEPILTKLEQIENRDALLNADGTEAAWPEADAIIGNPPFLGGRKLKPQLGDTYVRDVRAIYGHRLPNGADLVCYWFEKARELVVSGGCERAGFVATNSIRGGSNRWVLDAISASTVLFDVWDDEAWVLKGAAVRVAMVSFGRPARAGGVMLNGVSVDAILSDLTPNDGEQGVDLSSLVRLQANTNLAFQGVVPRGEVNRSEKRRRGLPDASFLMSETEAQNMLRLSNPNGRSNIDVLKRYLVGDEITTRLLNRWIVDFNVMTECEAAQYEAPFEYIMPVKLHRAVMNQAQALTFWWRHWNSRPKMRQALQPFSRYIATPRVSKHRLFVWQPVEVLPDCQVVAIAKDDDVTMGILHSRFHELWSLRLGTFLGVGNDPRYTPSTTFETFPFPPNLQPTLSSAELEYAGASIAKAARNLLQARENWLIGDSVGDPRTLTILYNRKPKWLMDAHLQLDRAVAESYGWESNISDNEVFRMLLALNAGSRPDAI